LLGTVGGGDLMRLCRWVVDWCEGHSLKAVLPRQVNLVEHELFLARLAQAKQIKVSQSNFGAALVYLRVISVVF